MQGLTATTRHAVKRKRSTKRLKDTGNLFRKKSIQFDSRKDSQSTKFERRPPIFVKISFRELCDSKLSGLHAFDDMDIIH